MAILFLTPSLRAGVEAVYVSKVLDSSDQVIIRRRNGEVWLLEYGVGVISIWQYEGKAVLIKSPGIFGGVGSPVAPQEHNHSLDLILGFFRQLDDIPRGYFCRLDRPHSIYCFSYRGPQLLDDHFSILANQRTDITARDR